MEYGMHCNTLLLSCAILTSWISIESVRTGSEKSVAKVPGNMTIGALFPVHHRPSSRGGFTRKCGNIREQYGIHRIEMFLKTLDEINASPHILPNVTLGCDIRDSCWYPPVALEQSIDFIKNSIASLEKKNNNRTGLEDGPCDSDNEDPIAGLIGPGSSAVTIQIQNLLSLFHIPQIGYSATSKDLSDKSLYKYFLRVVPSDKLQARALLDIVKYYNWTYISTVYTEGNYGSSGMEEFSEMLQEERLCEATADKVVNEDDDKAHDLVIENLLRSENARVVVCFCEGLTIRRLLQAAERKKVSGRFLFVGSDGWNVRPDVVKGIEELAIGGISMKLYSPDIDSFNDYFLKLKPYNNSRNPWFKEFWQEKFNCSLRGTDTQQTFPKECTGNEDLSKDFTPDAKLGFVVNAIYTMAHALDHMQRDICGATAGLCKEMKPVNGSLFLDYLYNVSFLSYSNDSIHFNKNGDPPGRYDIMNYQPEVQANGTVIYKYVRIGGWNNGKISLEENVYWPGNSPEIRSVCSEPCPAGQIKQITGGRSCCWTCVACKEDEYLLNESSCKQCSKGWRPDKNLTGCYEIEVEYMQWGDSEAIVAMVFSCIGVIATGWTATVFIRHNDTPVVKASTRELSYIILIGISISFLTSFPLVAKPTLVTCYLARILPGFSFSLIYGALVTKTNRIARILAGSKKKIMTRKPRFMSASAQLVITFIIIGIECAIITVMLIFEPADSKMLYLPKHRVRLICNATTKGIIVPLGFIGFLIAMCTLYAIKTRNLPENFNEAKFIGFTMYTTCIIWLAFVGIYFGSDNKVITMCMAITLSATVALVLLFFPKIYIIICKPEKNNRSAFTTSKDVRCHIGSTTRCGYSHGSMDRYSSPSPSVYQWKVNHTSTGPKLVACDKQINITWNEKTFENAALTIYRQRNVFDRWRRKSSAKTDTKDTSGSPAYSQVATSATAMTHGNGSDLDLRDERMTPQKSPKGKVIRRIKAPAPFKDFEMEFDEMDAVMEDNNSNTSDHKETITADSAVQTGSELLQELLTGLRKRKTSSSADKSEFSHYEKNSNHSRSTSTSTPSGSNPSDQCLSIKNNYYRNNGRSQSNESAESKQAFAQKYCHSPQHDDNSPLLSPNRDVFEYASTSEETLSELAEPMHDLDTLLMDVEPHKGSLCSLKDSTGNLFSDSTASKTSDKTVKQSKQRSKGTRPSSSGVTDNKCEKVSHLPPQSRNSSESALTVCSSKQSTSQRLPLNGSSGYRTHSPLTAGPPTAQNVVIPRIRVEQASRSSSDVSADSGRPSDCAFDSRRTSLLSGRAERTSAEISSIEDLSLCVSDLSGTEASVFHSPDSKQKEADSVTEFREYLRTKGLKLDLNSVQSSQV